jgi:hypothetical protein
MTKPFWQPAFDPMDALLDLRRRVRDIEQNQLAIIQAQNDLGWSMKTLIEQHNIMAKELDQILNTKQIDTAQEK